MFINVSVIFYIGCLLKRSSKIFAKNRFDLKLFFVSLVCFWFLLGVWVFGLFLVRVFMRVFVALLYCFWFLYNFLGVCCLVCSLLVDWGFGFFIWFKKYRILIKYSIYGLCEGCLKLSNKMFYEPSDPYISYGKGL